MAKFDIDFQQIDNFQQALQSYPGDAEKIINDIFHNDASPLIQDAIRHLMPVSGRHWKGKKPAAKTAKSLTDLKGNLSITIHTTKSHQYLYFPDDGTNTRRHAGNQQFFKKGGESQQDKIVGLCILKLVEGFKNN